MLLVLSCVVKVMMISTPTASVASSEVSTFTASKPIASVTTITPAAPATLEVAVNCLAVDLLDHGFLLFLRVIGMLNDHTLSWKWCRLFVVAQGFCLNLNFVVLKLLGNNWLTFNFMLVIGVSSHVCSRLMHMGLHLRLHRNVHTSSTLHEWLHGLTWESECHPWHSWHSHGHRAHEKHMLNELTCKHGVQDSSELLVGDDTGHKPDWED